MGSRKKKAVFTAEPEQLEEVQGLVEAGRYRSASEFLRDAIAEKLQRLRRERLVEQVERYTRYKDEEIDLVAMQAFDADDTE